MKNTDIDGFYTGELFQAFFKTSTQSLILKANPPHFTILAVSDSFLTLSHTKREDILGKPLFEVFPDNPVDPEGRYSALKSIEKVLATHKPDALPVYKYDVFNPELGRLESNYYSNLTEPLHGDKGEILCLINTTTNITQQVAKEKALEEARNDRETIQRNQALEAQQYNEKLTKLYKGQSAMNDELLKAQDKLINANSRLTESESRFRSLVEQIPTAINVFRTRALIIELPNEQMLQIWGRTLEEVNNKPVLVAMPELNGQPFLDQLYRVLATGKAYYSNAEKAIIKRNGKLEECYFNIVYQPIVNEDGNVNSILQICTEVTTEVLASRQIRQLNEDLAVTNEELRHTNEEMLAVQHELLSANTNLAESEERFRNMAESTEVLIAVADETGKAVYFNKAWVEMSGRSVSDLLEFGWVEMLHPDDRTPFVDLYLKAVREVTPFNTELRVLDKHGRYRWLFVTEQPRLRANGSFAGFISSGIDITEQKEAAQNIQHLNEEQAVMNKELSSANKELQRTQNDYVFVYNELLQNQQDLLFTIEAARLATFDFNPVTGTFTGNDLLKSWFGLTAEENIELQRAIEVIAEDDRERVATAINTALQFSSGGIYDVDYKIINPSNPVPRTVKAMGKTLFNNKQEAIRLSGVLQDVTEQKKDEQRKDDFIGMVSHEMKTPITSLSAYLQLLQTRINKDDRAAVNMIEKANKQVGRMTTLINGFLNVSRLESGKIQIDKQLFDMADLVKEAEEETATLYNSHKIIFHPVERTMVMADRDKIAQVINNLISNAVKYSATGTTINVACITIRHMAEFSVKDEGIGIKPEDQAKLFERYYRVEGNRITGVSGFGIGLYLCAEIIERHDGKIWVESDPGKGSAFTFTLPVEPD